MKLFFAKHCIFLLFILMAFHNGQAFASEDEQSIIIDSKSRNWQDIRMAGKHALFLTENVLEVWDIVSHKKIGRLSYEEFLSQLSTAEFNTVPTGIDSTWPDVERLLNTLKMQKRFFYRNISLSADGSTVALVRNDGSVLIWDTASGKVTPLIPKDIGAAQPSTSGRYIGIVYNRGKSKSFAVIDLQEKQMTLSIPAATGVTGAMSFSNDEQHVYVGITNFLLGYNIETGENNLKAKLPIRFKGGRQLDTILISPDDNWALAYTNWGALVNLKKEQQIPKFAGRGYYFSHTALFIKYSDSFYTASLEELSNIQINEPNKIELPPFQDTGIKEPQSDKMCLNTLIGSTYYQLWHEQELSNTKITIKKIDL